MNQKVVFEKLAVKERTQYLELFLLADESEAMIERYLNEGEAYLIQIEEKTIGVILFTFPDSQTVEIKNIAIEPCHQEQGIGKQTLALAESHYAAKGFSAMVVGTANSSISAIVFYQKAGFRINSIKKDIFLHYPEPIVEDGIPAIDMLIFEKKLKV
ncbi:MAG: GNAT family N-acetyltransferase [Carnobacterium sp.]|uniref:GNAT family N-acetyltransferase n=1 Tax=Carnobacterium sp. TaxID=48221 RepID=UPI002FC96E6C